MFCSLPTPLFIGDDNLFETGSSKCVPFFTRDDLELTRCKESKVVKLEIKTSLR